MLRTDMYLRKLQQKRSSRKSKQAKSCSPDSFPKIRETDQREETIHRTIADFQRVEALLLRKNQSRRDSQADNPLSVRIEPSSVLNLTKSMQLGVFSLFAGQDEMRELSLEQGYGTHFGGQAKVNSQGQITELNGRLKRTGLKPTSSQSEDIISLETGKDGTRTFQVSGPDWKRNLRFSESPDGRITVLEDWHDKTREREKIADELKESEFAGLEIKSRLRVLEYSRERTLKTPLTDSSRKELKSLDEKIGTAEQWLELQQEDFKELEIKADEHYASTGLRPGRHL